MEIFKLSSFIYKKDPLLTRVLLEIYRTTTYISFHICSCDYLFIVTRTNKKRNVSCVRIYFQYVLHSVLLWTKMVAFLIYYTTLQ